MRALALAVVLLSACSADDGPVQRVDAGDETPACFGGCCRHVIPHCVNPVPDGGLPSWARRTMHCPDKPGTYEQWARGEVGERDCVYFGTDPIGGTIWCCP